MHKSMNYRYEYKFKKEEDQNSNGSNTGSEEVVVYFSRASLSKPATRKRIMKLLDCGLIEKMPLSSKTLNKEIINYNLRREKPYKITDYGLFCILCQEMEYPVELFSKYWKRDLLTKLLSPYFEERKTIRPNPYVHIAVASYLCGACNIINEALKKIKELVATTPDGDKEGIRQERQDIVVALKDDLAWHAKSFALRLLIDSAADKNTERRKRRIHTLQSLKLDKKFSNLLDTIVHEVQSSYKGL